MSDDISARHFDETRDPWTRYEQRVEFENPWFSVHTQDRGRLS